MNDLLRLPFAEMTTEQLVFLGGLIILVGILLIRSRRYFARKARQSALLLRQRHRFRTPGHHHEKPSEMQRWEVEMHEMARELSARLDSKMVVLEQLIRDADAATARLQAALETAETEPHTGCGTANC